MKTSTLLPRVGDVIAGRFTLLGLIGAGGMGVVYRADDGLHGQSVALKLLRPDAPPNVAARFLHEAQLLSELRHPGIVQYVDHGQAPESGPYLAMAFLTGEDLASRLSRAGLTAKESLDLLHAVAAALTVAHRRGIVHRDLKPQNIFLRNGEVAQATLLDFGIAHRPHHVDRTAMTQTGTVMGTPEYMSPEQARGERGVGPSADIFSLGAILFECLTGQPPFSGAHFAAVLAKILFAEPPPLSRLRPELPPALEVLVGRMLAKTPADRPQTADALLSALPAIGPVPDSAPLPKLNTATGRRLLDTEQHFVCALAAAVPHSPVENDATIYPESISDETAAFRASLEQSIKRLGMQVEWLPDGTLLCRMSRISHAADQVRQAARAALRIAKSWPQAQVAVATGQGLFNELSGLPIGAAFERVMRVLRSGSSLPSDNRSIVVDELTARFLETGFRIEPLAGGLHALLGTAENGQAAPRLLGRPTPFVGRDQELGNLLATCRTSAEELVARPLLITAPAGTGKSRLLHELRLRLTREGTSMHWLSAQADPGGCGQSGGLIGQAVGRLCELREIEDLEARRLQLKRYLSAKLAPSELAHATAFLGELCATPFPEAEHPMLATARLNPQVRDEQQGQAVLTLLSTLCREHPTVLVLEDLHWGDEQTVRYLDLALRELAEQPFVVLAFARPEVHDVFPKLWAERNLQEQRLLPLGRRACERLIQSALGDKVDSAILAQLIAQSSGNALFLEELIRARAEGHDGEVPATVLAMLQARLLRLPVEVRRVLRAASVYGASCFRDGVAALLEIDDEVDSVDAGLQTLVQAEILERRAPSRLPTSAEYGWRHTLMQQAAYSLVPDEDRSHRHAQAAAFLVRVGVGDPQEIAGHFEQGGDPIHAMPYYLQAAQHSHAHYDLPAVLRFTDRAMACGASEQPRALGMCQALRCTTYRYQGDTARMMEASEAALPLLPRGDAWWFRVLYNMSLALRLRGELTRAAELAEVWTSVKPLPGAEAAYLEAGAWFTVIFSQLAEHKISLLIVRRLEEFAATQASYPLALSGMICMARSEYIRVFAADPSRQLTELRTAVEHLAQGGTQREFCGARISLGQALAEVGDLAGGVQELHSVIQLAERIRQPYVVIIAKAHAMAAQAQQAATSAAAAEVATEILNLPKGGDGFRSWAHSVLAQHCLRRDAVVDAAEHLKQSLALSSGSPIRRLHTQSQKVHLHLRLGETAEALALATEILTEATARGGGGYCAAALHLAACCAHFAAGDLAGAQALHRTIKLEIERRASLFSDEKSRLRYLQELPENAVVMSSTPWTARFPW